MNLKSIALQLPGFPAVSGPENLKPEFVDLASFLSGLLNIAFFIAVFLTFYFLVWGGFQYILASGNKEELAKARSRIRWALIGLLIVFIAYFIARFAGEIFKPGRGGLPF